ncbi:MAG: aldo/keto reductase, partial [Candidatus Aminicenantes bacterium]|nr:aldo/keto reductase [Candidatus Aminicenantes bacterium]
MRRTGSGLGRRAFIKKGLWGAAGLGALSASAISGLADPSGQEKKGKFITRTLGQTGIRLPVISMGVMNADNENLVRAALDAGIVHLDTAHGYQRGRNEEMIGRVIKDRPRDSYVIATKVAGTPRDRETGLFSAETKGEMFLQMLDLSLKRLGLDRVDILYLHNVQFRDSVLFEPLLKALETAKSSGKTRFVGISTHSNQVEAIQAATESKFYDVVLTGYNFREQNLESLIMPRVNILRQRNSTVARTVLDLFLDPGHSRPPHLAQVVVASDLPSKPKIRHWGCGGCHRRRGSRK